IAVRREWRGGAPGGGDSAAPSGGPRSAGPGAGDRQGAERARQSGARARPRRGARAEARRKTGPRAAAGSMAETAGETSRRGEGVRLDEGGEDRGGHSAERDRGGR